MPQSEFLPLNVFESMPHNDALAGLELVNSTDLSLSVPHVSANHKTSYLEGFWGEWNPAPLGTCNSCRLLGSALSTQGTLAAARWSQ